MRVQNKILLVRARGDFSGQYPELCHCFLWIVSANISSNESVMTSRLPWGPPDHERRRDPGFFDGILLDGLLALNVIYVLENLAP